MQKDFYTKILQLIQQNPNDGAEHGEVHEVKCAGCGNTPMRGVRYKCLQCSNVDLCARCFECRVEPKHHKSGHALVHFRLPNDLFGRTVTSAEVTLEKLTQFYANEIHQSVSCDGCSQSTITGLRFKCDTCPNYDLCQKCFVNSTTSEKHKSFHPVILSSSRMIYQISHKDIDLGETLGKGAFGQHNVLL